MSMLRANEALMWQVSDVNILSCIDGLEQFGGLCRECLEADEATPA